VQPLYFLASIYPWWGIPMVFIMLELGGYFRRQAKRRGMWICRALAMFFASLAVAYFAGNGYQNVRPAIHEIEKRYSN
jgi:hypothetical protein